MKKLLLFLPLLVLSVDANASIAYGTLNNFDTVNDTGVEAHGFEIEIEGKLSTDITYTYDYNHYGKPRIYTDPALPNRVFIRYESLKDASGKFTAYTAVPSAPIPATQGHQCTNPNVNFGCEHFGVGYYGNAGIVKYNWLIEDVPGSGNLVHGPAVDVATPTWIYNPPFQNQPAQVIAKIVAPPEPPEIEDPKIEFGDAVWVKQIITTSHNNNPVELKDLVSDDPDDPDDKNWRNGEPLEPPEIEIKWEIQQKEFKNLVNGGDNNEKEGEPEDLPNGDEVITRRYEFYEYIGPFKDSNEIRCDKWKDRWTDGNWTADEIANLKPECQDPLDNSKPLEVVGNYIGAQMAAFNAEVPFGLIDNVQDGTVGEAYPDRTIVVGGNTPYVTMVISGALPDGLSINPTTGVLSGTPTQYGVFTFKVEATDTPLDPNKAISKEYTVKIVGPANPPISLINNIPDGKVAEAYPASALVAGGNMPYVTTIKSGALPDGLKIDSATGVLSGTPTKSGDFTFTVEATDTSNPDIGLVAETVSKGYMLKIIGPVIPKGDLDADGDVDSNDLTLMRGKFGQPVDPNGPYDMNGDGKINVIDFRTAILLCTRPKCAVDVK